MVTFTHPTCGDQGFPDGTEGAGSLSSYNQCAQTRKSQPTGACQAPGLKILKENNPPALLRPKKILGRFQNKYWWLCFVSSAGSRALALGSALAASPRDLSSSNVPVAALSHISTHQTRHPLRVAGQKCSAMLTSQEQPRGDCCCRWSLGLGRFTATAVM